MSTNYESINKTITIDKTTNYETEENILDVEKNQESSWT